MTDSGKVRFTSGDTARASSIGKHNTVPPICNAHLDGSRDEHMDNKNEVEHGDGMPVGGNPRAGLPHDT